MSYKIFIKLPRDKKKIDGRLHDTEKWRKKIVAKLEGWSASSSY